MQALGPASAGSWRAFCGVVSAAGGTRSGISSHPLLQCAVTQGQRDARVVGQMSERKLAEEAFGGEEQLRHNDKGGLVTRPEPTLFHGKARIGRADGWPAVYG